MKKRKSLMSSKYSYINNVTSQRENLLRNGLGEITPPSPKLVIRIIKVPGDKINVLNLILLRNKEQLSPQKYY